MKTCCSLQVSVVGLGREEDCFWTMTALLESRLPASCTQEVRYPCVCFFRILKYHNPLL